jgi:hypothetical protein
MVANVVVLDIVRHDELFTGTGRQAGHAAGAWGSRSSRGTCAGPRGQ